MEKTIGFSPGNSEIKHKINENSHAEMLPGDLEVFISEMTAFTKNDSAEFLITLTVTEMDRFEITFYDPHQKDVYSSRYEEMISKVIWSDDSGI